MKKIYITPSVEVQKIDAVQMICESLKVQENEITGQEAGFQKGTKDRGDFEMTEDIQPAADTYGDLWQ